MSDISKIEASYPLSPMQEAMLLGYILAPESGIYIVQVVGILHEALNLAAFRKAWEQIIARHHLLRTAFRWENLEEPVQDVYSSVEVPFEIHEWQRLDAAAQKIRFEDFLETDRKMKVDLTQVPIMRLAVFRMAEAEFKFVWTYNHIIVDGSSHEIFLDELFRFYESNSEGREIILPPAIPYQDYITWLRQQDPGKSEDYWRNILAGFKAPTPVSPEPSNEYFINNKRDFDETEIRVSEKVTNALQNIAKENQVTLNNIVQGAWALLLSRYSSEDDVVFGTVRAGRHWGKGHVESMVGLFIHNLPMRTLASPDKMLLPWLQEMRQAQYAMRDHEATPLADVQKWSEVPRGKPLFESILVFLNSDMTTLMHSRGGKMLNREFFWCIVDDGYPLTLYANLSTELILKIAFDRDRFDSAATRWILENLRTIFEGIAENPNRSLGQLPILYPVERKTGLKTQPAPDKPQLRRSVDRATARRAVIMQRQQIKRGVTPPEPAGASEASKNHDQSAVTIAISSTFTAEPVAETLKFWGQKLQRPFSVEFAPYNQVFQQLLSPITLFSTNTGGMNVVLIRFEDWIRDDKKSTPGEKSARIKENVDNLILALKSAARQSAAPFLVCLCPDSATSADPEQKDFLRRMENMIVSELADTGNVYTVKSSEIIDTYQVAGCHDAFSDELGHVPYTPEYFTALGTVIARKVHAAYSAPYKVIVLDCDQTLWKGVCGEDGHQGIEIDPPRKALQEFMVEQVKSGMLICLCSKNNEEDVNEVFKNRPEMPLRPEHITAGMINWRSKSENLKALSASLELGLDSFIFIDDNPLECGEVQSFCPEVLTLCLPEQADKIPGFLRHIWAFDHLKNTDEDKKRTVLYRQNAQRKSFQEKSLSLTDFIAGLGLKVQVSAAAPEHLARVAQLTQRTNQFNLTTVRRSEAEIKELCQSGALECLIAEVSDRFGDYGLVGVVLFSKHADAIKVDTFLLSCRVMGKGVEHNMLARLGAIARERGLGCVEVTYLPTRKNQPALDFLEAVSSRYKQPLDSGFMCRFPAEYAGSLTYVPGAEKPVDSEKPADEKPSAPSASDKQATGISITSDLLISIATHLNTAEKILKNIESRSQKQRPEMTVQYLAPVSEFERAITGIWQKVLGIDKVGVHDNFFDIGGTSVKGVQLIAQLNRDFKVNLPIVTLFEKPTIKSMAAMLAGDAGSRKIYHADLTVQRQT